MTDLKPTPPINPILSWIRSLLSGVKDSRTITKSRKDIMDAVLSECGLTEIDREQDKIFISGPMTGYVCLDVLPTLKQLGFWGQTAHAILLSEHGLTGPNPREDIPSL